MSRLLESIKNNLHPDLASGLFFYLNEVKIGTSLVLRKIVREGKESEKAVLAGCLRVVGGSCRG